MTDSPSALAWREAVAEVQAALARERRKVELLVAAVTREAGIVGAGEEELAEIERQLDD